MGPVLGVTEQMRCRPAGDGGGLDFGHMLAAPSGQPGCHCHPPRCPFGPVIRSRCVARALLTCGGLSVVWVVDNSFKNEGKNLVRNLRRVRSVFRGLVSVRCFHSYLVLIDSGH